MYIRFKNKNEKLLCFICSEISSNFRPGRVRQRDSPGVTRDRHINQSTINSSTASHHHHLGHRATKVMGTRQANQPSYPHRKPLLLIYCLASIERTREKQRDRRRFMTSTSLQYSTDIHQPPIWSMATSNWMPSPPLLPCYRWRTFYLLLGIATTSGQWRWREAER